jgi:hypothetical protein
MALSVDNVTGVVHLATSESCLPAASNSNRPAPGFIPSAPSTPAFTSTTSSDDLHLPRLSPAPSHTNLARLPVHHESVPSTSGNSTALSLLAVHQADQLVHRLQHVQATNDVNQTEVGAETCSGFCLSVHLSVCPSLRMCGCVCVCVLSWLYVPVFCVADCAYLQAVDRAAAPNADLDVMFSATSLAGIATVSTSAFPKDSFPPASPHRPPRGHYLPPSPALAHPHRTMRSGTIDSDRTPHHTLTVDRLRPPAQSPSQPRRAPSSLSETHAPTFDLEKDGVPDESDMSDNLQSHTSHVCTFNHLIDR